MSTTHHIHMSIEGALNQRPNAFHQSFEGIVTDDNGNLVSPEDFRKELEGLRDKGHKLFPMSTECVGFDPFGKGCPGHPTIEKPTIEKLQAENAIQAQRIRHLEEEVERLKKALRIADEAVNIATDSGVY